MKITHRISKIPLNLVKNRIKAVLRSLKKTPSNVSTVQQSLFSRTYNRAPRLIDRNKHRPNWLKSRRTSKSADKSSTSAPAIGKLVQLDLFVSLPEPIKIRQKFSAAVQKKIKKLAKRRKKKILKQANLQYDLRLRVLKNERVKAFNTRIHELDTNDFVWTEQGIRKLHYILLTETIKEIKDHADLKSSKAAEMWYWIEREGHDEDFAFDTCVAIAGEFDPEYVNMDPEVLRNGIKRILLNNFKAEFPHAKLLKKGIHDAEAGIQDAIEWVISDSEEPLSFNDCCQSLGFDPEKARQEITIDPVALLRIA